MIPTFTIFRGRSTLDTLGLIAIVGLLVVNAFHFNIYRSYPYYREFFGVSFLFLSACHLIKHSLVLSSNTWSLKWPLFFLLLFPALLFLWSFIDPGVFLYGDDLVSIPSERLTQDQLSLYVLRNALLYLPMVIYVYMRGLNLAEIRLVALTAAVVAPLSINAYLQSDELARLQIITIGSIAEVGGRIIPYNTYVPYLTFSIICSSYLLFAHTSKLITLVALICTIITTLFCFFSTSRQSMLFIVIVLASYVYFFNRSNAVFMRLKIWMTVLIVFIGSAWVFFYLTQGYDINVELIRRFGSLEGFTTDYGARFEKAVNGLAMLSPYEWLMGAGLTSVMVSGPHNDYVRWTQRVGLPLMIFGFMPFFIAFRESFLLLRSRLTLFNRQDNSLLIFLTLSVGFTLFHSFFCYPREESNQAVAVYMGLALWIGACREGLLPVIWHRNQTDLQPVHHEGPETSAQEMLK